MIRLVDGLLDALEESTDDEHRFPAEYGIVTPDKSRLEG